MVDIMNFNGGNVRLMFLLFYAYNDLYFLHCVAISSFMVAEI